MFCFPVARLCLLCLWCGFVVVRVFAVRVRALLVLFVHCLLCVDVSTNVDLAVDRLDKMVCVVFVLCLQTTNRKTNKQNKQTNTKQTKTTNKLSKNTSWTT